MSNVVMDFVTAMAHRNAFANHGVNNAMIPKCSSNAFFLAHVEGSFQFVSRI